MEFPEGWVGGEDGVGSWKKSLLWGRYGHFSGIIQYKKVKCYIVRLQWNFDILCNEGSKDWQSMFVETRLCCIKVLFSMVYCYWGHENLLLYWGLLYIQSTCRGLLNQGSTVTIFLSKVNKFHNWKSSFITHFDNLVRSWKLKTILNLILIFFLNYTVMHKKFAPHLPKNKGLLELAYIYQCNMKHLL